MRLQGIIGLYIILLSLYFVNLTNITLFNGKWDGIGIWLNTGLFIAGTAYFLMSRETTRKNSE